MTPSTELLDLGINGLVKWIKNGFCSLDKRLYPLLKFPWVYHHLCLVSKLMVFSVSIYPCSFSHSSSWLNHPSFSFSLLIFINCPAIDSNFKVDGYGLFLGRRFLAVLCTWVKHR